MRKTIIHITLTLIPMQSLLLKMFIIGNLPVQAQLLDHHHHHHHQHLFPKDLIQVEVLHQTPINHRKTTMPNLQRQPPYERQMLVLKRQKNGRVKLALYLTHIYCYDVRLAICVDPSDERRDGYSVVGGNAIGRVWDNYISDMICYDWFRARDMYHYKSSHNVLLTV